MRVATDGDSVLVHYTGYLDDGSEFDTSRGRDPLNFVIGSGSVIRGFDDVCCVTSAPSSLFSSLYSLSLSHSSIVY